MSPSDFQTCCPGTLVQTQGWEEHLDARGRKEVRQVEGIAFVPDALPPKLDRERLFDAYAAAHAALGELRGLEGDLQFSRLLAAPLLLREARVSSKIENTIASAEEVAEYESGRQPARQEAVEVSNYRVALEHGLRSSLPLSKRLVCEMHELLLRGVRGENTRPGEIRTTQNRVGGARDDFDSARFVPPPPGEHLEKSLNDLELFWNRPPRDLQALLGIALAHYQFEAIHPFGDGNGRLGRAIVMLSVCRMGLLDEPLLYLSGYFDRHRTEYYDLLLRVSTHGDWTAWCSFFLKGIAEQAHDSADRLRKIREIREQIMQQLREETSSNRILSLVDMLIERPYIDAKRASNELGVSDPAARKYIKTLEKLGFLRELTGSSYGQVWGVAPIFAIIDNED